MSDQKAADLARQEAAIQEGNRKFDQMESNIYSKAGEDFQRGFFNMTRTERQMYGLKMVSTGSGSQYPSSDKVKWNKKIEWWSKCCKAEAFEYRSIMYGGGKPQERFYRCRECYNDCEVQKTKPRRKKRST